MKILIKKNQQARYNNDGANQEMHLHKSAQKCIIDQRRADLAKTMQIYNNKCIIKRKKNMNDIGCE